MTDTKNTVSEELLADWRKGLRNCWDEDECPSWPVVETHVDALFQSLRASIPGGVGVQCCMCGKTGLSITEGDGGTECQLEDGRWTCSEPCWEKAGGYGPDLSPAEGEALAAEVYIRDWCPDHVKDHVASLAAPSNPVISDEMVERGAIALAGYDWGTCVNDRPRWRDEAREVLTAALSVKPQSGI